MIEVSTISAPTVMSHRSHTRSSHAARSAGTRAGGRSPAASYTRACGSATRSRRSWCASPVQVMPPSSDQSSTTSPGGVGAAHLHLHLEPRTERPLGAGIERRQHDLAQPATPMSVVRCDRPAAAARRPLSPITESPCCAVHDWRATARCRRAAAAVVPDLGHHVVDQRRSGRFSSRRCARAGCSIYAERW